MEFACLNAVRKAICLSYFYVYVKIGSDATRRADAAELLPLNQLIPRVCHGILFLRISCVMTRRNSEFAS